MSTIPAIILVDDDETTVFLHKRLFARRQLATPVLTARNGQEALELLAQPAAGFDARHPALLLLDLNMPVMDGFAFLAAYAKLPEQRAVVVVVTSSSNALDLYQLQQYAVAGVLQKPLTAEKVATLLDLYAQAGVCTN